MMKPVAISTARKLGNDTGAQRIVVIAVAPDGAYAVTTWGKTKEDCRRLAHWCDNVGGEAVAMDVFYA